MFFAISSLHMKRRAAKAWSCCRSMSGFRVMSVRTAP
jgi:hypothetical protein